jgi:hypothetical protein
MDNTAININTSLAKNEDSITSGIRTACNTLTDVHEPIVAAQNQTKQGEATKTAGLSQSFKDNKAAKAARLQAEAETAKKMQAKYSEDIADLGIVDPATGEMIANFERLCAVLKEQNLAKAPLGDKTEPGRTAIGTEEEKALVPSPEQIQLQKLQTENTVLRRLAHERQFAEDLAKIKELNPKESAQNVFDLGETFFTLRRSGIEVQTAYEASRAEALRNTLPVPAAIGSVNGNLGVEKDFYTPTEVDRLTEKDFKRNPKLLEKVQRSMRLWQ